MRVSPGPSTRTWPPVNAAISEFVVPKSIPAIRSLILFLPSGAHETFTCAGRNTSPFHS